MAVFEQNAIVDLSEVGVIAGINDDDHTNVPSLSRYVT
jgi:hypothetical protein